MSVTGYYDGTAIRVEEPLRQKVIAIPIENKWNSDIAAAGGLYKYGYSPRRLLKYLEDI